MITVTVDDRKRVRIPDAKPKQVFSYQRDGNGRVTLTPVEPARGPAARLVRKNGHTYLLSERKITDEDVKRGLEDFPSSICWTLAFS